jgi:hypothetical protein
MYSETHLQTPRGILRLQLTETPWVVFLIIIETGLPNHAV